MVCGAGVSWKCAGWEWARFLKFLRVWGGFKLCGVGADKKFQPVQDSKTHCTTADKLLIPSFSLPRRVLMSKKPEVAMDSESTPAGFCVLVSDTVQDPESKFVKKRTQIRSHFSVSAVA